MSKSIASYPVDQRKIVVERRLKARTEGVGYLAAVEAAPRVGLSLTSIKASKPRPTKAPRRSRDDNDEQATRRNTGNNRPFKQAFAKAKFSMN